MAVSQRLPQRLFVQTFRFLCRMWFLCKAAGTAIVPLAAALRGYRAIGIELEPKWAGMARGNVERLNRRLGALLDVTIIQGDAREMGALPDHLRIAAVVSPPYEDSDNRGARTTRKGYFARVGGVGHTSAAEYGHSLGQLGQERGASYLEAMSQVFQAAARVCDVLVIVSKNPTRQGKLRRLDKDLLALMKEAEP